MSKIVTVVMLIFSTQILAADVFEDFESDSGGFDESEYISASGGRYIFSGDRTDTTRFSVWNGGSNPGGWDLAPGNSNYFENFNVSADTLWLGGADNNAYGLKVCVKKNRFGNTDSVRFFTDGGEGWYLIDAVIDGNYETLIDWTRSSLVMPYSSNNLSIAKVGNEFRFYINYAEVQQLQIDGCVGGAIGMEASQLLDAAFDNFSIVELSDELIINQAPTASFLAVHDPLSGKLVLDASGSYDPDGSIALYQWASSDGQTATGQTATMHFGQAGTYTISLVVTDNGGLQSEPIVQTVTVPDTPILNTSTTCTVGCLPDKPCLCFDMQPNEQYFNIGERFTLSLNVDLQPADSSQRFDLYVALALPHHYNISFLYLTAQSLVTEMHPFKQGLDQNSDRLVLFDDYEVAPCIGGTYIYYAALVREGNSVDLLNLASNLAEGKVTLEQDCH